MANGRFMVWWRHIKVIDREIRQGGYPSAPSLGDMLELPARTVKRRIHFMRYDLGAPIEYDASRKGYFYRTDWALPPLRVSNDELMAIGIGERILRGLRNPKMADHVQRVLKKISTELPEQVDLSPEALVPGVGFSTGARPEVKPQLLQELLEAVREGITLRMVYYKLGADEEVERTVQPYAVQCVNGEWYMIGRDVKTGHLPMYNMARIRRIEPSGDEFDPQATDFDIEEYLSNTLGAGHAEERQPVKVRFRGWAARYVCERQWHPSQKIAKRPDGEVEITFESGWFDELSSWALSFGEMAEVLEPPELREQVEKRLRSALAQYAAGGPSDAEGAENR
jgi:predicted DNA-binding transcriptional regulator YafY